MEANKEEQGGVVCFLLAEGAKFIVAGLLCMTNIVCPWCVHEWQKRFRGLTSLQDDSRPEQFHRAITPDVIARIDDLIRENRLFLWNYL